MNFFRVVNNLFRFNRTNWKAVSLCFLAATVFWFFNALNKNYSSNVRLPLKFEFDQRKFIPSRALPADVYVNLSGNGWDLLRKYLGLKLPAVVIPLERPVETKKIVGSTLPALLASQVGNLKINHIVTDTLYISIEPRDSLKLKVVVDHSMVTFREGFGITSPVVVLPDSIKVIGPRSLLTPLAHSSIQITLPEKRVSSNYRQQIDVSFPEEGEIQKTPASVEVMFEVGEVTEVTRFVLLDVVRLPNVYHVMKDRDSVQYTVRIPASHSADFEQASVVVKAELDLSDARSGGRKMIPSIVGLPAYATLVSSDSVRVKIY